MVSITCGVGLRGTEAVIKWSPSCPVPPLLSNRFPKTTVGQRLADPSSLSKWPISPAKWCILLYK